MDTRQARKHARRAAAEWARHMQVDPGVIGDPDDCARLVEAYGWLARFLAPGELSVPDANLRPLVTSSGTAPDEAPAEWGADHDEPAVDPVPDRSG